jgi:hypothetical protein
MVSSTRSWSFPAAGLLAVLSGFLLLSPASAQEKQLGTSAIEEAFNKQKDLFDRFVRGLKTPGEGDKTLIDTAAKYYVYRLTWFDNPKDPKVLHKLAEEFSRDIMEQAQAEAKKNQKFMQFFCKALADHLKELLDMDFNKNKLPCLHGCFMLHVLARTGNEDIGDLLTDFVKDSKRHPAVQLYALKSLKEFFAARPPTPGGALNPQLAREAARIEAVLAYLDRKVKLPENAPREEVDTVIFIRREAVRALAETRVPAMDLDPKTGKVLAPVAHALLRVATEDKGFDPPITFPEQAIAVIGLMQMRSKLVPEYQVDLTIDLVGRFLEKFADEYNKDFENFRTKGKEANRGQMYPWKNWTVLVQDSFRDFLEKNTSGVPAMKDGNKAPLAKVKDLKAKSEGVLEKSYYARQVIDPIQINTLNEAVRANRFPEKEPPVYQGIPQLKITLP